MSGKWESGFSRARMRFMSSKSVANQGGLKSVSMRTREQ